MGKCKPERGGDTATVYALCHPALVLSLLVLQIKERASYILMKRKYILFPVLAIKTKAFESYLNVIATVNRVTSTADCFFFFTNSMKIKI